jgi:hypothetical protein
MHQATRGMIMNEPPDADEAATPRESLLSGTLGQLREFLRARLGVKIVVVWQNPDDRVYRASNASLGVERSLLCQALGEARHHDELAEVSEISEADP